MLFGCMSSSSSGTTSAKNCSSFSSSSTLPSSGASLTWASSVCFLYSRLVEGTNVRTPPPKLDTSRWNALSVDACSMLRVNVRVVTTRTSRTRESFFLSTVVGSSASVPPALAPSSPLPPTSAELNICEYSMVRTRQATFEQTHPFRRRHRQYWTLSVRTKNVPATLSEENRSAQTIDMLTYTVVGALYHSKSSPVWFLSA